MSTVEKLLSLAQSGDVSGIELIISRDYIDGSWKNAAHKKSGDSLLNYAARFGHLGLVQYLHEKGDLSLELSNFDGKTALHEAAHFGHIEVLRYLLDQGANVDCLKRADW